MEATKSFTESNSDVDDFDYYGDEDFGVSEECARTDDPERLDLHCLDTCQVESLLNECVATVSDASHRVGPALAKMLLHCHHWNVPALIRMLKEDSEQVLIASHIKPARLDPQASHRPVSCSVCVNNDDNPLESLNCGHAFCRLCWQRHCELQIARGVATRLQCMQVGCEIIAPEDFVLRVLSDQAPLRAKYQNAVFRDHVNSHPELRFCPGLDCQTVIRARPVKAKRAQCSTCSTSFCFQCGCEYHAPTSCDVIKKWWIKCADDSETANYISAHTKDCPQCHACIEKNGGCNHMQCAKCKHHFCWICFGDWKTHGSEYYECSRYKENPMVAQEANHMKARRALEKYLHYYERFENHSKSLKLEEELRARIAAKIEQKVNRHEGTWIDWQHLLTAATLLTKCRYTLQYTYPFAYYMENGPRKQLFEFQQGQLEKEIEELSWKTERAETTDRGDLENQMSIAEKKRQTLLHDFLD